MPAGSRALAQIVRPFYLRSSRDCGRVWRVTVVGLADGRVSARKCIGSHHETTGQKEGHQSNRRVQFDGRKHLVV